MIRIFSPLLILALLLPAAPAGAQEKLTLTITPPFFQLTISPGDFWASSLKVVNTNPEPLTIHASLMDFYAEGEEGQGRFAPAPAEGNPAALSSWIEVSSEPVTIQPEQSGEIPFTIRVPEDAPPGGHYAAILIGTRPFEGGTDGPLVKVSSFVSSLFFVRIPGNVHEAGHIREFSTDRKRYDDPRATFTLRFENTGNVHIQPQGSVTIYNMWGKERGKILINEKTEFGNVLPQSVRKFSFEWSGEDSLLEAGKYTAVATLAYGKDARQNVTRTVTFWVVPLRATAGILGGFLAALFLAVQGIRLYVRKALRLEMERRGGGAAPAAPRSSPASLRVLAGPVREGVVDLRALRAPNPAVPAPALYMKYRFLLKVVLPLLLAAGLWVGFYFREVMTAGRAFEVKTAPQDAHLIVPAAE